MEIATSYYQILRAQCVVPRISQHHCRAPLLNTDKGQAVSNLDNHHAGRPHHFYCSISAILNAQNLAMFSTFFHFPIIRQLTFISYLSIHLIYQQSTLVASKVVSDPSELVFTSYFLHRCRYIAVAESRPLEKKAWYGILYWKSPVAPGNACRTWQPRPMANGLRILEYAMRCIAPWQ